MVHAKFNLTKKKSFQSSEMEQDTGESSDRSDIPGLVMEVEYDTDVEGEDNDAKMGYVFLSQ